MSDPIERKAAIDEIARWIGYIDEDMILRIQIGLKKVPSAQGNTPTDTPTDTISRKAAIDALCNNCDNAQAVCAHYPCKQYIAIEKLSSAQPEQHYCRECK